MFHKAMIPALLLLAPSAAFAGTDAQGYEAVRAPAGKTVTGWRQVDRPATNLVTCPPDSTKAFWCHARKAEAAARNADRSSDR